MNHTQLPLFDILSPHGRASIENHTRRKQSSTNRYEASGTFINNMALPVHRWFRYSAGFSAAWVADLLRQTPQNKRPNIFDPFSGSGTVLLEASKAGYPAIGTESHPLVTQIAEAKLMYQEDPNTVRDFAKSVTDRFKNIRPDTRPYPDLIRRCYPDAALEDLDRLKQSFLMAQDGSAASKIVWLIITSILRECSPAGTAQWQYILPNKSKARTTSPLLAFEKKLQQVLLDMDSTRNLRPSTRAKLLEADIRTTTSLPADWADLLITSPPYANNYDYADATRLEMCFWGNIPGYSALQERVRKFLIRSCTQAVSAYSLMELLNKSELDPIRKEITQVCTALQAEKKRHGGKKNYDIMIACYFYDMALAWKTIRRVMRDRSTVCFVVGDSAPYGIYAPVDEWLGQLAIANGFRSYTFEKIRDRNIKWKNRKHRIPLKEGRLWIKG